MPDSFDVKEKKGVLAIEWNGIKALLVPQATGTSTEIQADVIAGLTGVGVGANAGKKWVGDSIFLIEEGGKIDPYEVWRRKKEIEASLALSGVVTNISQVGTIITQGTASASAKAEVVAHNPKCPKCGVEMDPLALHACGIISPG